MPRSYSTLTLDDAKHMLSAAEAKAASFGIAYNIAVVDAGGHLLAFVRQDGALIGSIDLAINKAVTARIFDKTTSYLAQLSQPGSPPLRHSGNQCRQGRHLWRRHTDHVEWKHYRRRRRKRGDC